MSKRIPAFVILALLAAASLGCGPAIRWWLTPAAFDTHTPTPAPDYAELATWGAHPDKADPADLVPPDSGAVDRQAEAAVDVFFIHPTTYYKSDHFNAPWDEPSAKEVTDTSVLALQASSFNGAGRIYAPYYRQIALGGYFTEDRDRGLALAYGDVERAFDHWLGQWSDDRPFILASHSQGSRHAQVLLRERFAGEPGRALRERLVAAYLIGGWIPEQELGGALPLPACEGPTDTGCLIGWRTLSEDATPRSGPNDLPEAQTNLCTNPLSWTRSSTPAPASAHQGALPLGQNDASSLPPVTVGMLGTRCADGSLKIDPTPSGEGWESFLVRDGDFHVYDYPLFSMNIRANAEERVAAYLAAGRGR